MTGHLQEAALGRRNRLCTWLRTLVQGMLSPGPQSVVWGLGVVVWESAPGEELGKGSLVETGRLAQVPAAGSPVTRMVWGQHPVRLPGPVV